MIKATIVKNGMSIDLECSTPSEFVDIVRGAYGHQETKASSSFIPVTSRTRKYQHHPWTDRDIASIANMITENKENLGGIGIRIARSLKASGDCRVRNFGTVWSKVAELKDYLLTGGTDKIPEKTIRQLTDAGILPMTQRASSSFAGSRRVAVAHEA